MKSKLTIKNVKVGEILAYPKKKEYKAHYWKVVYKIENREIRIVGFDDTLKSFDNKDYLYLTRKNLNYLRKTTKKERDMLLINSI